MATRRVRQHVNPLGLHYVQPRAQPLEMPGGLGDVPVDVELGCADARFSFQLAAAHPERLVVGVEIRDKVVAFNNRRADAEHVGNLKFVYANLNVDLDRVFAPRAVERFFLLFPDPWFKSKHRKRRVVEEKFLSTIAEQLKPRGEFYLATDVFEIAIDAMSEMEDAIVRGRRFENQAGSWSFWRGNPYPAQSRREQTTVARGQRVWRLRYRL